MSLEENPLLPMRALAQRLLILEGAVPGAIDETVDEAARVFERLRLALARFAGSDGFTSLVRRALALARAQDHSLCQISVRADGLLEGLEQVSGKAVLAIITQFLALLVTFVGEPLTLRLVRDAWPDQSLTEGMRDTRPIA